MRDCGMWIWVWIEDDGRRLRYIWEAMGAGRLGD